MGSRRHWWQPARSGRPACTARSHKLTTASRSAAGQGIVVNGDTLCTLTTIGTDGKGELIGFTSAHCGGPGAPVVVESAKDRGAVGTMVAGNDNLDYAVIQFDTAKVTPVANFGGFVINGIGPDPAFGADRLQAGPHDRQLVRRHVGPGSGPGHHRHAGVRTTG